MNKILVFVIIIVVIFITISGSVILFNNKENIKEQIVQSKENFSMSIIKNLKITVIYDNYIYNNELESSWGFSCLISGGEKNILFDTGEDGSILLSNMRKLGINPEEIDLVVLSHAHLDHIGGLSSLLEINPAVTVYLLKSFPVNFKDDIRKFGVKVIEVQDPLDIGNGFFSTGELGTQIKEQSLIIQTEKGLIIITGCAHPGILEIINKAKKLIDKDILFVMGGFHLAGEREYNINKIISEFKKLGVRYVGPCHCSGDEVRQMFKKEYGVNFINVGVGKVITLDELK